MANINTVSRDREKENRGKCHAELGSASNRPDPETSSG